MREIPPWFGLADAGNEAGTESPGEAVPQARQAVVLGCPFEGGDAFRGGAREGAAAIREWAATAEAVTEDGRRIGGLRVLDRGDVEADVAGPPRWDAIESAVDGIWEAHSDAFLLVLGGDHAVTPPVAAATRRARGDMVFLMLDAHLDAFDEYDGDRLSHACVLRRLHDRAGFAPQETCVAGVRSWSPEELDARDALALCVDAREWAGRGSLAVAEAVASVTGGRPLYLSLDIDVLDPSCAPGTGYPVAGGVSSRHLLRLLEEIWERHRVVAMDVVEVAPSLDATGITAATAAHVCLQALGHVARPRFEAGGRGRPPDC